MDKQDSTAEVQRRLAEEAVQKVLPRIEKKETFPDGTVQISHIHQWTMQSLSESIQYLISKTGKDNEIDPYKLPDGTAWIYFSNFLTANGLRNNAVEVMRRYLDVCYELQNEVRLRMHKGATYFWLSEKYFDIGNNALAQQFMLYAFVEDIQAYQDPFTAPAYFKIKTLYEIADDYLRALVRFVHEEYKSLPNYPEEVIVNYDLKSAKTIRMPVR